MQTYLEHELISVASEDWYAVRDEGFRRQEIASKKVAKIQKQLAKAQAELDSAQRIITAAMKASRLHSCL